ncbi:MAG: TetR/AcrR family transcriptional regulator [Gammaproteobacteria bacterium]|nr:TetR/AcrR family transcriptional regulator [Gammaproteobacteria bacterium]MDH4315904.1 TetR/AcrR family transcriptional regulator [Gammaproteobacteria bacterium]MDH5215902.1 TetR/AcrR family transcriptional regulator [Gammaproteobacteria bacterium]
MAEPRFRRRKEDRPAEITAAALAEFSDKGYDAARVDDVAKRAGVSKGLLYLYFRTKEELFKAVVRSFVSPRIQALENGIRDTELSAEAFLRGPFLEFAKQIPKSPVRVLVRLIIAEGPKYPDLTKYYWDNVVTHGLSAIRQLIARGVRNGEFKASALDEFPQMLVAPVLFSVVWTSVFSKQHSLDSDRFIETNLEIILSAIRDTA